MPRARARNGRFTAERTTETTTRTVTERLTVEAPAAPGRPGDPSPVFTRLLASAQWDPGFAAYLGGRPEPAVLPPAVTPAAPAPPPPVPAAGTAPPAFPTYKILQAASRTTYEALYPDTLTHEFTDADRARLEATLCPEEYLP